MYDPELKKEWDMYNKLRYEKNNERKKREIDRVEREYENKILQEQMAMKSPVKGEKVIPVKQEVVVVEVKTLTKEEKIRKYMELKEGARLVLLINILRKPYK